MYQLETSKKNPKSSQSLQGRATNRFFMLSLDLPYQVDSLNFIIRCKRIGGTHKFIARGLEGNKKETVIAQMLLFFYM